MSIQPAASQPAACQQPAGSHPASSQGFNVFASGLAMIFFDGFLTLLLPFISLIVAIGPEPVFGLL